MALITLCEIEHIHDRLTSAARWGNNRMTFYRPTLDDVARFRDDGYVIVRNLLTPAEVELLNRVARADKHLAESAYGREDAKGAVITLAVENHIPDDIYGAIIRSPRIVHTMEMLLGDEVYHYHHKMILKEPFTGGAWAWHQDYGYWYHNGCLRLADDAYGIRYGRTSTALRQWYRARKAGFGHTNRMAPIGAQLFWRTSNPAGHVATYVGRGLVVTNMPGGRVKMVPWRTLDRWGPYLGWAEPYYG